MQEKRGYEGGELDCTGLDLPPNKGMLRNDEEGTKSNTQKVREDYGSPPWGQTHSYLHPHDESNGLC